MNPQQYPGQFPQMGFATQVYGGVGPAFGGTRVSIGWSSNTNRPAIQPVAQVISANNWSNLATQPVGWSNNVVQQAGWENVAGKPFGNMNPAFNDWRSFAECLDGFENDFSKPKSSERRPKKPKKPHHEITSVSYSSASMSQPDGAHVNNYGSKKWRDNNCYLTSIAGLLQMSVGDLVHETKDRLSFKIEHKNGKLKEGGTDEEILEILKCQIYDYSGKMIKPRSKDDAKAELIRQFRSAEKHVYRAHRNPKPIAIRRIITYDDPKEKCGHATVAKVYRNKDDDICYTIIEYQENDDRGGYKLPKHIKDITIFDDNSYQYRTFGKRKIYNELLYY